MARTATRRVLQKLDNLSVRRKLILSYTLGFLLPLLLITSSMWVVLTTQARRGDERRAQTVLELVRSQLYGDLAATTRLVGLLASDSLVTTTLDDWRIDRVGHLVQYRLEFRAYLNSFVTAFPQVSRLEFYTTNQAVVRGGAILYLNESTRATDWARAVSESGRTTVSVLHLDRDVLQMQRALSLVSNLGTTSTSGPSIENYVRIDLDLAEIRSIIQRSVDRGSILLVDRNDMVVIGNVASANNFQTMVALEDVRPDSTKLISTSLRVATNGPFSNLKLVGYFPYESNTGLSSYLTLTAILVGAVGIVIASLIQLSIGYSLSRRLQLLTKRVRATRRDHFPTVTENPGNDELGTLIGAYNEMTTTIDRLIKEVYEEGLTVNRLAVEKRHAELEALISKIDPHFLSNSLNTIRMKSLSRKEVETADALKALGRLFDYMTAWQDETILVRQEVEFISGYLALQRYRFGSDYQFEVDVDPAALDLPLPRMLVQPLVENASEHGVEQKKTRGKIQVSIRKRDDRLEITVTDDGRGMDSKTLALQRSRLGERSRNGESIGMQNVYNRLLLIFGEDAEFDVSSRENEGTRVRLSFPFVGVESNVESNTR